MVYFVADAHLGSESQASERSKEADLVRLLAYLEGRAAVLYAVGDLFDFWFEYPEVASEAYSDTLSALRSLTRSGTSLHFLGGNHDYWAGPEFEAITGGIVHREPVVETHFGRRLFIAHGDGLPAGDLRYRALKAVIRSRPAIAGFRLLGPTVGWALARWASGLSDVTEERIRKALSPMRLFLEAKLREGFDAAVVGHVHRPCMWRTEFGTAVIVGDWMRERSVVELGESGFRMLRWDGSTLVPALIPAAADSARDGNR
jgi:UDP-2,3-diacylglucosamine hydrolase